MRTIRLLALLAPLVAALPVSAAEWAPEARSAFVQECVAGAKSSHSESQLKAYCDCAADKVSAEFSETEVQQMSSKATSDPAVQKRLIDAASSCNAALQP